VGLGSPGGFSPLTAGLSTGEGPPVAGLLLLQPAKTDKKTKINSTIAVTVLKIDTINTSEP
jgi:hypothetical protein